MNRTPVAWEYGCTLNEENLLKAGRVQCVLCELAGALHEQHWGLASYPARLSQRLGVQMMQGS